MAYSTRARLETMYGETNIVRWASLDNDQSPPKINDRIVQALDDAESYIDGRMILGRYAVPFTSVPKQIVFLTTLYAGVLLYDGRQVRDKAKDEVSRQRMDFKHKLREILGGQLRLIEPLSGLPVAITDYNAMFVAGTGVANTASYGNFGCGCGYPRTMDGFHFCPSCLVRVSNMSFCDCGYRPVDGW